MIIKVEPRLVAQQDRLEEGRSISGVAFVPGVGFNIQGLSKVSRARVFGANHVHLHGFEGI